MLAQRAHHCRNPHLVQWSSHLLIFIPGLDCEPDGIHSLTSLAAVAPTLYSRDICWGLDVLALEDIVTSTKLWLILMCLIYIICPPGAFMLHLLYPQIVIM